MVSVIIPVYNVEQYLRRCIDSVLAQTYTDLEIILVDDGSPDGSGAICDEYAAKDSRIKVIHQANAGVSAARNAGMDLASGEYLAFIDSDDFIEPEMYEQMLAAAEKTGADVVECNYRMGQQTNQDSGELFVFTGMEALEKMFSWERLKDGFAVSPFNKLLRTAAAEDIRFLEGCTFAEDALFATELFGRVNSVAKLDRTFYTYYMSEGSAVRSDYSVRRADEVGAYCRIVELLRGYGNEQLYVYMKKRWQMRILFHWLECYMRRSDPVFRQKAKQLKAQFRVSYDKRERIYSKGERVKFTAFLTCPHLFYVLYSSYLKKKGYEKFA